MLREYVLEDFGAVHSFASDPRIARFVDWGPNTEDDTRAYLEGCIAAQEASPRTVFTLAITLPGGVPVGSVGLTVDEQQRGHLGYVVGVDHWGRGYATEAATCLLAHAHNTLELDLIEATCRPANVASARVLEKIGMTFTGVRPRDRFTGGQWSSSLVFAAGSSRSGPPSVDLF
ncbi:GNAT family N-acetyltransferase [uncultured Arthrobacter sp.]|uniref:GNAT family N-acetyltransferase n=1 Tax=uncultured Arthrobacter sp. TaxID=114050 RepID=UPI0026270439|nr:GNAT family N-acetyltransferase [uncultured Arthrobacter sp.]